MGKINSAFDGIRAESSLKVSTLTHLQGKMKKQNGKRRYTAFKRLAPSIIAVSVIFFIGIFSYNIYFAPNAYIDIDINPAVEFTVNRFDRIISVYAYNLDGEDILLHPDLKHKKYKEALGELIDTIDQRGYIKNNGLVSVTVQTDDAKRENELTAAIQSDIISALSVYHSMVQVDVYAISGEIRSQAFESNVSPVKYLAILELMEVDSTVTVDSYRHHSVGEIRQMTQEYAENHHSGSNNGSGHHGGNHE